MIVMNTVECEVIYMVVIEMDEVMVIMVMVVVIWCNKSDGDN